MGTGTWIDKSTWGEGAWADECDRLTWLDDENDWWQLEGVMHRNELSGSWCGYVGVPHGHPWYNVDYEDLSYVIVHGGLTYAGHGWCNPVPGDHRHCLHGDEHTDLYWYLGFDCAHGGDTMPKMMAELPPLPAAFAEFAVYRDELYVFSEIDHLMEQAKALN